MKLRRIGSCSVFVRLDELSAAVDDVVVDEVVRLDELSAVVDDVVEESPSLSRLSS